MNDICQQMTQTTRIFTKMINDDKYSRRIERYQNKAITYKQQIKACQETISHLRQTIYSMEKQFEQLKLVEDQEKQNDYKFVHELFNLCLKHPPYSLKLKSFPSHQDMKTYVQQAFHHLIKRSSKVNFTCKCSDWINPDHYPNYQYCLDILEHYQKLFDVKCFKEVVISLTDLYHKYGELNNFIRSIASTVGVNNQDEKFVIKALENVIEDSKSDEMNKFKKLVKVKDMIEAIRKLHSYDNFVPYYHQFLEQLVNSLEVSKREQIIPALKTLKLLAHNDSQYQWTSTSQPLSRNRSNPN